MNRFFVSPENVKEKSIIIDSKEDLKHLSKVLRLKPGDEIEVSDGAEWEYRAVLTEISPEKAVADITDKQAFAREPDLAVTLFQGIPKQTKMDGIVQKSVLDVSRPGTNPNDLDCISSHTAASWKEQLPWTEERQIKRSSGGRRSPLSQSSSAREV